MVKNIDDAILVRLPRRRGDTEGMEKGGEIDKTRVTGFPGKEC
jgi:hypothetical protein